MYECILILGSVCVFMYSHYSRFVHQHSFDHMVAFVGRQHVRTFEHIYRDAHADLWAFGHRKRKSTRLKFGVDPFETFRTYDYKYMLLVEEIHPIPLLYSDDVIEYKWRNQTVASLWPYREDAWPADNPDVLAWYKDTGAYVSTIHL